MVGRVEWGGVGVRDAGEDEGGVVRRREPGRGLCSRSVATVFELV